VTPFARILVGYEPTEQGGDARALGVDLASACGSELQVFEASSSPARALHDAAASTRADLVVVGSSHRGPVGRVLLGSVSERLLSGAPCAVAVAPLGYAGRQSPRLQSILIAFDGSPEAHLALSTACALAARTRGSVRALTVIEPPPATPSEPEPYPGVYAEMPFDELEQLEEHERTVTLEHRESAARASLEWAMKALGNGAEIEHDVIAGEHPASLILDVARGGADLLVLGSRASGPVHRALVGSVSVEVVRHAPCPVLVTPRVGEGHGGAPERDR